MLAPEQKDATRLKEIGPPCDIFSFAALAVFLLTEERFTHIKNVNWSKIPKKWIPFLQSSLSDSIKQRPKDFTDFDDWLTDPELVRNVKLETEHHTNFHHHLTEGSQAMSKSNWKLVRYHFREVLKISPGNPQAHVKVAIACYELGDLKNAEQHYTLAKKCDPVLAKGYRDHVAFHF